MIMRSKAGMTLIEVLVALSVFALIAVPLFGAFSYSIRMERRALIQTLSTYAAQMTLEEAYGADAQELLNDYATAGTVGFDAASGLSGYGLHYSCTVVPYNDPSLNLYRVTVTVGDRIYEVSTTLEDIFYAAPPTPAVP